MDIQLDTAPCGYFSIISTGTIQSVNQTLLNMLGYERQELLGKHIESTLSVTNKLFFHTYFYPYIQMHGYVNEMYFSFRAKDGQDIPVLLNGVRQERGGDTVIDCVAVMMRKRIEYEKDMLQTKTRLEQLVQAAQEANKQLERLHMEYEDKQQQLIKINEELELKASTDPLTGLRNRRYFQEHLKEQMEICRKAQMPLSLLILDIDHFKKINDSYGHPVGDMVLSGLAGLLRSLSRESDIAARYGGEEFVIILPGADQTQAVRIAERYRSAAADASWEKFNITISAGVALMAQEDTDNSLLQRADQALYASKAGGRNRVTLFE